MKAAVLRNFRGEFSIEDVEPQRLPAGWVRVKVRAVGVCGRDLVVWKGGFRNLKPPLILGHEVFGELNGDPVGVYPGVVDESCVERGIPENLCPSYSILGETMPGGYAEYVDVPRRNVVPLPDRRFEAYAASVCGLATFIHASKVAGVRSGDSVLVTGASGGVSVHGMQYLQIMGVKVVGVTRNAEKAKTIERELGIEVYTSFDEARQKHGKFDAVFEVVGAPTINDSMRAVKPGGVVVLIGNVEGTPIVINRPALLVMREIKIVGSAAYTREEYEEAVRIAASGSVKPFYRVYKLEDINRAYRDILEGRLIGRAVLVP
ncbi:MAG: zinc-binding dehydrogenase [Thermoproteota archaeon]